MRSVKSYSICNLTCNSLTRRCFFEGPSFYLSDFDQKNSFMFLSLGISYAGNGAALQGNAKDRQNRLLYRPITVAPILRPVHLESKILSVFDVVIVVPVLLSEFIDSHSVSYTSSAKSWTTLGFCKEIGMKRSWKLDWET